MQSQKIYSAKLRWVWLSIMVIGTLGISVTSLRAEGVWVRKADMPTARVFTAAAVVDGIIYVIGGATIAWNPMLSVVEAYDPKTDTWERKADMPTPRATLSAAVVDGKIYAMGGDRQNGGFWGVVEVYDPATDEWTKKADMPTSKSFFATDVVDGIIYVLGGLGSDVFGAVDAYDPATDKWTERADMPTPRWAKGAAVDGMIYVLGGGPTMDGRVFTQAVEAYDPSTDTWIEKADMPALRENWSFGAAPVVNGKIYLAGKAGMARSYDPATDTWEEEPDMLTPRAAASFAVVNDKIYAIGGGVKESAPGLAAVEEFTPEGWPFGKSFSVSPQGKMPALWGKLKVAE